MFNIDFDPETAFERTMDHLENISDGVTHELANAVAGFYYKLDEVFQKVNSYFE